MPHICKCQDSNGTVCGAFMSNEQFMQDGMCDDCACMIWEEIRTLNAFHWEHPKSRGNSMILDKDKVGAKVRNQMRYHGQASLPELLCRAGVGHVTMTQLKALGLFTMPAGSEVYIIVQNKLGVITRTSATYYTLELIEYG